jgi:hypothetical protein
MCRLQRPFHSSRPALDLAGTFNQHPAFKLASSSSDFVQQHNQNNEAQRTRKDKPKALRAARRLLAGDCVHQFHAGNVSLLEDASHWTLQVGPGVHINLANNVLRNMNHSCEPNVLMRGMVFEALRDIRKNEELCLDYNCSELDLAGGSFQCSCGSTGCVGRVEGWTNLAEAQRAEREGRCQPWLIDEHSEHRTGRCVGA